MTATLTAISDEVIEAKWLRGFRDVRRADLEKAFHAVADKANWKNPIDATVALTDDERDVLREAIVFFAGCEPTFEDRGGVAPGIRRYRVRADGYYIAVGA